jgi:coenzyme F420-0:L-glutamate ligase/coenzyme F420-1:gamma-L-glutamate ligase
LEMSQRIELIPLKSARKERPFAFLSELRRSLKANGVKLAHGDILIISGKYLAMAEGRYVLIREVVPLHDANEYANRCGMSEALAETVLRESDYVLRGLHGFLLTVKDGFFAPNAGVDKSNIPKGKVILHPSNGPGLAARIRREVLVAFGVRVGVVITDSRLQPLRRGTVGTSIGFSGLEGVADDRGREDLFGNRLKVTRRAVADDLSSAAELLMGESDEGVPVVVARGTGVRLSDSDGFDISVSADECIFVRGLAGFRRAHP